MKLLVIKKPSFLGVFSFIQILMLFLYLIINIVNVGEAGSALWLLAIFFVFSTGIYFLQIKTTSILIPNHSYFFLLLLVWISLRVTIDLNDISYLKQIIIGTTGGVLLFYLIGIFSRKALNNIVIRNRGVFSIRFLLVLLLTSIIWVFLEFQGRLLDSVDRFYIEDINGSYQRAGNFLIIFFIMLSFSYIILAVRLKKESNIQFLFWLLLYTVISITSVVNSQLFGSNGATANIIAIYLITVVISALSFNRKMRDAYLGNNLSLPISKKTLSMLFKYAVLSLVAFIALGKVILDVNNFDLSKTRLLGFGSGENTSLTSRFDILFNNGLEQLSYAPILGNTNVAFLTTGYSGLTLHSFIPNIMAELGLIGVLIVFFIFFHVFKRIVKQSRLKTGSNKGYEQAIISSWLFFIFLFVFIYANLAVGKSWIVIWFMIGFISVNLDYKKL